MRKSHNLRRTFADIVYRPWEYAGSASKEPDCCVVFTRGGYHVAKILPNAHRQSRRSRPAHGNRRLRWNTATGRARPAEPTGGATTDRATAGRRAAANRRTTAGQRARTGRPDRHHRAADAYAATAGNGSSNEHSRADSGGAHRSDAHPQRPAQARRHGPNVGLRRHQGLGPAGVFVVVQRDLIFPAIQPGRPVRHRRPHIGRGRPGGKLGDQ